MTPARSRALWRTTLVELRLYLREPAAAFFSLLLPLILLLLNGAQGNHPRRELAGEGLVDALIPGYVALVIATSGLMTLPATLVAYRERGILRRLHATPLSPLVALAAQLLVCLVVTLAGLGLLVGVGVAFLDLSPPRAPLGLLAATLLGALGFFAVCLVLAAVAPSSRTVQAVAAALYFPMIFLSGATWPRSVLPDTLGAVGQWTPLTVVVDTIDAGWSGTVDAAALGWLAMMCAAGLALSARCFRWT
jgi:ABC-2 type transport system permease protein